MSATTTAAKERPIIFSAEMVRALLSGAKTQTRVVRASNSTVDGYQYRASSWAWSSLDFSAATARDRATIMVAMCGPDAPEDIHLRVPRPEEETFHRVRSTWEPGDRLWVRESFAEWKLFGGQAKNWSGKEHGWGNIIYKSTHGGGMLPECEGFEKWRSPIHMPRWASRLTLEVTGVRVERLQDIAFVWALTFRRVEA